MAELLEDGYQTLRDYANSSATTPDSWDYIEVYDGSGEAITRVSITDDERCQWTDVDGDGIMQVECDLTASDSDVEYPVTVASSALWNAESGGTQITEQEQFADALFNQDGDNVVITHVIEIPNQT